MKKKPESKILLCLLFLCCSAFAEKELPTIFSQVQFDLSVVSVEQVGDLGIPVDHRDLNEQNFMTLPVSQYGIDQLNKNNIPYKVLISDYAKSIEDRILKYKDYKVPDGESSPPSAIQPPMYFKHGSMGGYLILSEVEREMDEMRTRYPNLVSAKFEIGKSVEGRSIWAIRFSNNPDVEEDRTRIVYNTLTHPREPMAMMTMTWFLWQMLEDYPTNPDVKRIFDELELYYIPVVNPDGYEYNRSTNPNGGGLWRKNRQNNPDGTRGVDLNRNYSVNWGNNSGSSGSTQAGTYRGPRAFSEPETQAIRDFYLEKQFAIASTFHCYANVLLHPYGLGAYPTNRTEYEDLSRAMTRTNRWDWGVVPPTIGYSAAGIEIDWTHDVLGALGVNPEMGSRSDGGFWPGENRIDALALSGYDMNLEMAKFALPPVVGVKSPSNKITSQFYLDVNVVGGQMKFHYNLSDMQNSWFLTMHDLQGKQQKRIELQASNNSIDLSVNDLPPSLYLFKVSTCNANDCQSVYNQKLIY